MTSWPQRGRWNHNTHYHRVVLRALPPGARQALDVGCGDGDLLAELASHVPTVVGIDADAGVVGRARHTVPQATVEHGDFLAFPFDASSFDLVTAVASVHHMDLETALRRMADLVAPGGVIVVVGLARPTSSLDRAADAAGVVIGAVLRLLLGYREVQAPTVWPPPLSYAECRRVCLQVLPGARFRRRLLFRYTVEWTRPRMTARPSRQ